MRARTRQSINGTHIPGTIRRISPLFDDLLVERLARIVTQGKDPIEEIPNPRNNLQMLERLLSALEQRGLLTLDLIGTMISHLESHEQDIYDAIRREARDLGLGVQTYKLTAEGAIPWRWKLP